MEPHKRIHYELDEKESVDGLVIHCSDPKWRKTFEKFLEEELGLKHYALIAIPGSVSSVSVEMALPKRLKVLKDYMEFMVEHGKPPRLVIINHDGCRMYKKLERFFRHPAEQQQMEDLAKAAGLFKRLFPALIDIQIYMARVDRTRTTDPVYFEKVVTI